MNKAILIMDIPSKCLDCNLCILDMDASISCFYCKREICDNVGENVKRPDWCPLRELPDKKNWGEMFNGNIKGWNDCLKEITSQVKEND